ncbi:aquaporin [bacterium]|nr:aquaporin [bacterium]
MMDCFRKYLVEFIGTFFLVFTVGATLLLGGSGVIPAIAIGLILMVMVYAGGHISGGHYNPAVSMAAAMRGALSWKHLAPYWLAQILGALAAAFLIRHVAVIPAAPDAVVFNLKSLIAAEFLFTFALCYVVLLTATSRYTEGNSYYGLAIGATVTAGIFAVGGTLCMAAFNPAVALSAMAMGMFGAKVVWITILTNLAAGIIAALVFKMVEYNE